MPAGFAATGRESASSLLLRWDGTRWARIRIPSPPPPPPGEHLTTVLTGVSARSPADVMVTGWYELIDTSFETAFTAFTLRWNGHRWTRLPSPLPNDDVQMFGASVVSAHDAWTVGEATTTLPNGSSVTGTLSLHWNGSHWTDPATPY
jgi:hypothetical protein